MSEPKARLLELLEFEDSFGWKNLLLPEIDKRIEELRDIACDTDKPREARDGAAGGQEELKRIKAILKAAMDEYRKRAGTAGKKPSLTK